MSERVSLDRKEFETFLAENQSLIEKSQQLLQRVDSLEKLNKGLDEELKMAKSRIASLEATLNNSGRQGDEALRKARETMGRLMKETEKRISR